MSIVPNNTLAPVDSLTLQTFGIQFDIVAATNTIDVYTRHLAWWKSAVIRNFQAVDVLQYRTEPNAPLKNVNPNSELPLKGWGSFLQVISGAGAPSGRVDFECVNINEARRKENA